MRKNHFLIGLALTTVVILLASFARWIAAPEEAKVPVFPDRLQVRVLLPDEAQNEVRRVAYYEEDNVTLKKVDVEYKDGFTGISTYGANGAIATFTKFYPQDSDGFSMPHLELVYEDDGLHLKSEKRYFADGSLMREGKRLSYGNYAVTDYALGAPTQGMETIFTYDGDPYRDFERHSNGNLAKLVKENEDNWLETTSFNEAGVRTEFHSVRWTTHIVWQTYQADGEAVLRRFEQSSEGNQFATSYYITATYHRPDGSVYEERKFTRSQMIAVFKDEDGNELYKQIWKNKQFQAAKVESFAPDAWILEGVVVGGNSYWFDKTNGHLNRTNIDIVLNNGQVKTEYKWYHPDGTLAKINTPDRNTGEHGSVEFQPGESDEVADLGAIAAYIQTKSFVVPPQITPETVSHSGGHH